jgi:hypothetical protein
MTRYCALAVVVLFTLSACAVTPQPIQTSPLPTQPSLPQSPVVTPGPIVVVPTPAADSGVVTGVILVGKGQDAKPDTGDSMVVTASAGKTTDLGTLRYESLPSLRGKQ